MATILAHITVAEGKAAAFEAIARDLHAASHAADEGLLRYEYWRGSDPGSYYALLSFRDFASFIAHQTSDHHETSSPRIGEVVTAVRLEWVDPVEGAADLPRTEGADLSDAADELTRLYARRFAADIAPWWTDVRS